MPFKEDVIWLGYLDVMDLSKVIAAAYTLVYASLFEGFGVPVMEALQSGVPVITSEHSSMEEITGRKALFVNPEDPASIAEKMMLIYKDETLRNELIKQGMERAGTFSWDQTAALLWKCMEKSMR